MLGGLQPLAHAHFQRNYHRNTLSATALLLCLQAQGGAVPLPLVRFRSCDKPICIHPRAFEHKVGARLGVEAAEALCRLQCICGAVPSAC